MSNNLPHAEGLGALLPDFEPEEGRELSVKEKKIVSDWIEQYYGPDYIANWHPEPKEYISEEAKSGDD